MIFSLNTKSEPTSCPSLCASVLWLSESSLGHICVSETYNQQNSREAGTCSPSFSDSPPIPLEPTNSSSQKFRLFHSLLQILTIRCHHPSAHVPFSVPSLSLTKYTKLSSSSQKYSPKDPSGLGLTSRPNYRTPCAHGSDKKINKMLTSFLFAWKPLVLHRPEAKTGPSSLLLQCSTAGQSLLQFS